MATLATAEAFMARLQALASPAERDKPGRYGQSGGGGGREGDDFLGVRMGEVFDLRQSSSNGRDEVGLDARPRLHQDLVHHRAQQPLELLGGAVGVRGPPMPAPRCRPLVHRAPAERAPPPRASPLRTGVPEWANSRCPIR